MHWYMDPTGTQHWGRYSISTHLDEERGDYDWDLDYHGPDGNITWIATCGTGEGESLKKAALRHAGQPHEED